MFEFGLFMAGLIVGTFIGDFVQPIEKGSRAVAKFMSKND